MAQELPTRRQIGSLYAPGLVRDQVPSFDPFSFIGSFTQGLDCNETE